MKLPQAHRNTVSREMLSKKYKVHLALDVLDSNSCEHRNPNKHPSRRTTL